MKIIFLDIDGVLNYNGSEVFDSVCVSNLKYIVEETGAKIVLISTWKQFLDADIFNDLSDDSKSDFLYYQNLIHSVFKGNLEIVDITEDYFEKIKMNNQSSVSSLQDLDKLDSSHDSWRSVEVSWWLEKHSNIESFVIIDDFDCNYSVYYPNNWIATSWFDKGLKKEYSLKAVNILNNGL